MSSSEQQLQPKFLSHMYHRCSKLFMWPTFTVILKSICFCFVFSRAQFGPSRVSSRSICRERRGYGNTHSWDRARNWCRRTAGHSISQFNVLSCFEPRNFIRRSENSGTECLPRYCLLLFLVSLPFYTVSHTNLKFWTQASLFYGSSPGNYLLIFHNSYW